MVDAHAEVFMEIASAIVPSRVPLGLRMMQSVRIDEFDRNKRNNGVGNLCVGGGKHEESLVELTCTLVLLQGAGQA